MLKRDFKTVSVIAISMTMLYGTTTFAAVNNTTVTKNPQTQTESVNKHKGKWGSMGEVLKRLGITKEEMDAARKSGKTLFDIAKTKGHNEAEVRSIIIEVKSKAIDEKVKSGKITKEKGDEIKTKIKEKVAKWDGSFKHKRAEQDTSKRI